MGEKHVPGNNTYGEHGLKKILLNKAFWPNYGMYAWGGTKPGGGQCRWGFRLKSLHGGHIKIDYAHNKIEITHPWVAHWECRNRLVDNADVKFAFNHISEFLEEKFDLPKTAAILLYQSHHNNS
jgi:hypothetical protein